MIEGPIQRAMKQAMDLLRITGIEGAFVGGLAVIVWGRARATQDLDLIANIGPKTVDSFLQAAKSADFLYDSEEAESLLEGGGFIRLVPLQDGEISIPIDVLVADTPLHLEAIARSKSFEFGGESVQVISAEDLVLMKLVAFRPKDTFDLETVIDAVGPNLELEYLRRWADKLGLRLRLETFLTGE